ncbi:MAG: ShlB/FhaC/HecB family hemolysin secretion/activation protein [Erythrobacter sp.]
MAIRQLGFLVLWSVAMPPLSAQSALDRTDPDQFEEQEDEQDENSGEAPAISLPYELDPTTLDYSADSITVGSIVIVGNEALPDSRFVDIIESFASRTLRPADLGGLADAIAKRARDEGYIFATATIPEQDLRLGLLRVNLDEGAIDEIRIDGATDAAIRRQLEPLRTGKPVTQAEVERRILLADDISGVRILDTRFVKEGEVGVLVVRTRRTRTAASVEIRNNGSEPVGPVRARLEVDFNGLLTSADEVDLAVGTNPLQPGELQYATGSYNIVIDADGLELGTHVSYSSTDPGAFLTERDISGRLWRAGVDLKYPIVRRRGLSVWVLGEFEVTDLQSQRAGTVYRHDRIPALRAGIYSRGEFAGGDFRGRLMVSKGLDILSATQPGDPLASRSDASIDFTSLYGWFAWDRPIGGSFSVGLGGRGQVSSDPLLVTEDLGLGGTTFLRGYRFNERSGDQGIMGFGELRYDWRGAGFWLPRGQAYLFADGGTVSNLRSGSGGGSLASAGGGLRLDLTRDLDLDLELAFPLTGARFDSESEAPLFNLRVEQSF